jgi:hypothetical protein
MRNDHVAAVFFASLTKAELKLHATKVGRVKTRTPPASAAWRFSFCLSGEIGTFPDTTDFSRVEVQLLAFRARRPETKTPHD